MLGRGENWYFVVPNVEGKRPDGSKYRGLVITISWGGRVVRHCTSVSCPDGLDGGNVGVGKDSPSFANHLYGVFTCAKEKIVRDGHAGCAANDRAVLRPNPWREGGPHKKRLNRKRGHRRKGQRVETVDKSTDADKPTKEVVIAKEAAAVKPVSVRLPKLIAGNVGYRVPRVWTNRKEGPGKGTSENGHGVDAGKRKAVPSQPTAADLEVGGVYTVPRKSGQAMCRGLLWQMI